MEVSFSVVGTPAPQGSKSFMGIRGGKGIMVESSKKVKPWRKAVEAAAIEVKDVHGQFTGPIELHVTFYLERPKSAPKSVTVPFRKPDLSKLVRSTEDALTTAGLIEDDARIVRIVASKEFSGIGDVAQAGATISIYSRKR